MAIFLAFSMSPVKAEWEAGEAPKFVGGYTVTNTETGQTLGTRFKSKKQAEKAAEVLNKYDKSVMAGPDGQGDYRPGGDNPMN